MSLEISRHWHREPGWFEGLPVEEQSRLLAWWAVFCRPEQAATSSASKRVR